MNDSPYQPTVFLGGTCNGSPWRDHLIPHLEDLDYFDPRVEDWDEEARKREEESKENADFLLYCLTPSMAGFYSVAEVVDSAHQSAKMEQSVVFTWVPSEHVDGEKRRFSPKQVHSLYAVMDRLYQLNVRVEETGLLATAVWLSRRARQMKGTQGITS